MCYIVNRFVDEKIDEKDGVLMMIIIIISLKVGP